ncbi:MAG: hypothetical protein JWP11_3769 [Frankiales bacterium]|nr:hypothetical protein [Frankiales bacterium]
MQPTAPPGWYADPHDSRQVRWFDGAQWSSHVSPAPGSAYTTPAYAPRTGEHPDSPAHWMLPLGRSWQSIAAGYLGLFSILLIPAPFALGMGIWGLVVANKEGSHGRGRSIFGVVAGALGTLVLLVIFAQS